jgi:hypothetical protein
VKQTREAEHSRPELVVAAAAALLDELAAVQRRSCMPSDAATARKVRVEDMHAMIRQMNDSSRHALNRVSYLVTNPCDS